MKLSMRAVCSSLLFGAVLGCQVPSSKQEPPLERMQWWREARLGMFIHWGLYSIPAGEWKGSRGHGEWIRDTAQIPLEEYASLPARFQPQSFDARAWARLAREAGMKYMVITSKHHDGFCLWDSPLTQWDMGATPKARDLLGELKAACDAEGLRFGTYHSIMDWHHPDYLPRRPWEQRSTEGADFERYEEYLQGQVRELIQRYQPAVMWFDGEWERTWNHERGVELFQLCRELAPSMLVNNRVDVHRGGMGGFNLSAEAVGDFSTPEQEIPATGVPGLDWETCMTMNEHWGFNALDEQWKSSSDLIRKLCDIASKGGNFLLNVGPRADGSFPPAAVERLQELGQWMAQRGVAIYGTQASPFDAWDQARATVRGSTLYILAWDLPLAQEFRIPGLANQVRSARLLGASGELRKERRGSDWVLQLPTSPTNPHAEVIELELDGPAIVYRAPRIQASAPIFIERLPIELHSPAADCEVRWSIDGGAPVHSGALILEQSALVRAQCFVAGQAVSPIQSARFERVLAMPALPTAGERAGLRCQIFQGEYQRLPDLSQLSAVRESIESSPQLPAGFAAEHELRRYLGFLEVPERGVYEFALTSDDGSKLYLGEECVIDHDGLHSAAEKRGFIALEAGPQRFDLQWFNASGGAALQLQWRRAGQPLFESIPATRWSH